VVFLVALRGAVISVGQLKPQLYARSNPLHLHLTWRKMELGIDRAIDDPGLEAGVSITKGYHGCHDGSKRADVCLRCCAS
jgi:hypothetical protein